MKILQLSHLFPFPEDSGGKIGISNLTKEFAKAGHHVSLFCICDEIPTAEALREASQWSNVYPFQLPVKNTAVNLAGSLLYKSPRYLHRYNRPSVFSFLDDLTKRESFDIIHCEGPALFPTAWKLRTKLNIPLGMRLHNIEWRIWAEYSASKGWWNPAKWFTAIQARKMRLAEKDFFAKADICFPITHSDEQRARELQPSMNSLVSGAGIQEDEWTISRDTREEVSFVHTASLNWLPNRTALRWFLENVWSDLVTQLPEASLDILGKGIDQSFTRLPKATVHGYVASVKPFYSRADVFVAPLFVGSGVRIKIIEAMAGGLVVVASHTAAEGIVATPEQGLFLVETPQEWLDVLKNLYENPTQTRELGREAHLFATHHFTWQLEVGKMIEAYNTLQRKEI